MKKIFISFVALLLVFGCVVSPSKAVQAAPPPWPAFDASKMVFQNHIMGKGLFDNRTSDIDTNEFRAAVETAFLSVYTYQAKNKSDATYSTSLSELNKAIDYLYAQVTARPSKFADAYQSPGTGLILQAAVMIKKFNTADLTASRNTKVDYLYNNSKTWLKNAYNSSFNGGSTFKYIVENQVYSGTGENRVSPFSANIVGIHGGALALDSDFLFKRYGSNSPTDYPDRKMIADIGNYLKELNFGSYGTQGRLGNVGAARPFVAASYLSWHSMSLAQMAHGTVYTQFFSQRPTSVFMTEAEALSTGFKTVYEKTKEITLDQNRGFVPEEFYGFARSIKTSDDRSEWLYSLAWTGEQDTVKWVDKITRTKLKASTSQPAIVAAAATNNQNFNRALSGLTAGMLKGLMFD